MKIKDLPKKERTGSGHRKRLRERFLKSGLIGFHDYEIVELLLTLGTPRKDCKPMAKEMITEFGSLRNVLDASIGELQQIKGIGPSNAFGLKIFQEISECYAREQIPEEIKLDSSQAVAKYLQKSIGREKKEYFVMLSLGARNNLIKISNISVGSLNASIVHPREVFKEAIQASADEVIIAHNHPSGDPEPSDEDHQMTDKLVRAGLLLDISVKDHIIVTKDRFFSFYKKGLLQEYEQS